MDGMFGHRVDLNRDGQLSQSERALDFMQYRSLMSELEKDEKEEAKKVPYVSRNSFDSDGYDFDEDDYDDDLDDDLDDDDLEDFEDDDDYEDEDDDYDEDDEDYDDDEDEDEDEDDEDDDYYSLDFWG